MLMYVNHDETIINYNIWLAAGQYWRTIKMTLDANYDNYTTMYGLHINIST